MSELREAFRLACTTWPAEWTEFYLARDERRQSRQGERCWGISSDALARYALGLSGEPHPGNYPFDKGDLDACERTYRMAPEALQKKMHPTLMKYRARVAERYNGGKP